MDTKKLFTTGKAKAVFSDGMTLDTSTIHKDRAHVQDWLINTKQTPIFVCVCESFILILLSYYFVLFCFDLYFLLRERERMKLRG